MVHVWRASLAQPSAVQQQLAALLSADERDRAARFHFARDRRRFTAGRGILRLLVARYLAIDPAHVLFEYGRHGKPALAAVQRAGDLRFNLAHSGECALLAFARGREVGVDVEQPRPVDNMAQVVARTFSGAEQAALRALPDSAQQQAFFTCWTRKEAYIKARGTGLALPLDSFDVALDPQAPARLLATRDEPGAAQQWTLCALAPGAGLVAALGVEGSDWRLACWQWQGLCEYTTEASDDAHERT